jgi:hypothetical protein
MTDERSTKAGSTERAHHAGDGEPAAPRQRRMSAQRKQEAVLRVLRGEDLVNRHWIVTPYRRPKLTPPGAELARRCVVSM